jgi:hypothetical protein
MMSNHLANVQVGEANKLSRQSNFYVWSLKMKPILQREGLWDITETHVTPTTFPTIIAGE